MGQVLRLPRPRRKYRVKWSAKRTDGRIEILVEWRDKDRAGCAVHVTSVNEWDQLDDLTGYFWNLIEHLRDKARQHGARF